MRDVDISAPQQLAGILALSPLKASEIARSVGVSRSSVSHTFSGKKNRSLSPERIRAVATLLRLDIRSPCHARLRKQLYIWGVTTRGKRDALRDALTTWLGDPSDLVCNPVVPEAPNDLPGWMFVLVHARKGGRLGHPSVLIAFRDDALEELPARIEPFLPAMQGPVLEISAEQFKAAWERESALPTDGDTDAHTLLVEQRSPDRKTYFDYLLRCRTALGMDTSTVEQLVRPPARRVNMLPCDDEDTSPNDPDEMESSIASGLRDRLDRSRTGRGAWQVLAYEPGSYPGPWCAIGGIAIDENMLPPSLHTSANDGALRIIQSADGAYFVETTLNPWPCSRAIEASEGSYLLEIVSSDPNVSSYQIGTVRRRQDEFFVWPNGALGATQMHYDETLFGNPVRPEGGRFRILGRVVGRMNFFTAA